MRALLLVPFAVLAACGGTDNVGACEDYVASVSCGDYDASEFVDCSVYEATTCDISDYFNCLADAGTCTDDVYDAGDVSSCTALATCT